MNYFELLNIEEGFFIDKIQLKQNYFELSKKWHPDYASLQDEATQENALQKTALLNKAYKTLNNSFLTIEYILEKEGLIVAEEKTNLPQDFLMEMMDVNEAIVDAKFENNEKKLEHIKQQIEALDEANYKNIEKHLQAYNSFNKTQEILLPIKDYYYKKKYLNRILDSIR